nr:hypothetical protein [Bacillus xiamenensis]
MKQGKEAKVYLAEKNLSVKKQGEKQSITSKAVNQKQLRAVQKDIHVQYDELMEDTENRFHDYVRNFNKKVTGAYGYLYTAEDKQLFLQVKSMHIEIGWNGSFLITTVSEEGCKPYKEMKLEVGGFTDGGEFFEMSYDPIIEKGVIIGSTDRDAKSIKLPVKMTDGKVELKAFTKEEYKKQAKAFKKKAEEKKK